MLRKIIPRQENFFGLFQQAADELVGAAKEFNRMLKDLPHASQYAKIISDHEETGDSVARSTFDLLHKTFITPFDRNDIHQLTGKLDDILDVFNRTAQRICLYQLEKLPEGIQKIACLSLDAAQLIKDAFKQLDNLKHAASIIQYCRQINEMDSRAETIMLEGVGNLFANENDFKYLLKVKEVFEYSKLIISECHGLADIIKGIVLEYS